jgi:hypothetical protein
MDECKCSQCGGPIPVGPRPLGWWRDHVACMAKAELEAMDVDTRAAIILGYCEGHLRRYDGDCPTMRERKACRCKDKDHFQEWAKSLPSLKERTQDDIIRRFERWERKSELATYGFFG